MRVAIFVLFFITALIKVTGCKKKQQGKDYTQAIGGIRYWHGTYTYFHPVGPPPFDTTVNITDTFAFSGVDYRTLARSDKKYTPIYFYYVSTIDSLECYYFAGSEQDLASGRDLRLWYFYNKDSISYYISYYGSGSHGATSWYVYKLSTL